MTRPGAGPAGRRWGGEGGQSTVELVLLIPVVVLALLLVLQVALVARAQVLVVDAAREGARAAAVDGPDAAASAASTTPDTSVPYRVSVPQMTAAAGSCT